MAALAKEVDVRYTRYADDLTFSGDEQLERCARRFQIAVCRVALEEGFEVHTRKTRFMRQGVRQQVGGIVLNAHANFPRNEYDRLKAILFNCVCEGPESQNRDGHADFRLHLAGRVGYVAQLNPPKANRLRALFDRVTWAPRTQRKKPKYLSNGLLDRVPAIHRVTPPKSVGVLSSRRQTNKVIGGRSGPRQTATGRGGPVSWLAVCLRVRTQVTILPIA
jgi:hypothetical protein